MSLETIKDFDFGVGGNIMQSLRVAYGPMDVTKLEVDVIKWLLIEQEFRKIKKNSVQRPANRTRTQHDGLKNLDEQDNGSCDFDFRLVLANENLRIAKEYTQDCLRDAGVNLDFEDLSDEYREAFLIHLCRSSTLFQSNSLRSVPEIFHALRSASKFRSKFHVIRLLGKGEFGEVFYVKQEGENKEFAMKKISCLFGSVNDDVKMAINESNILRTLRGHSNIISLFDSWLEIESDDTTVYSDDDPCEGPLKFYLQLEIASFSWDSWKENNYRNKIVPERTKTIEMARQLFDGLAYINENNILHLDINPKNILWSTPACTQLKIVDFGLAVNDICYYGRLGTLPYVAPEQIMTHKSDVYSAAVTLIEIGKTIFTKTELNQIIVNKNIDLGDVVLEELLLQSMKEDPTQRPPAIEFKKRILSDILH